MESTLEVTSLISPIIGAFKALNNEWKHLFDIGVSDYLYSQTAKYYFTNTFIHRSEKVKFTDIYFPIKARYKKLNTDFDDINEIFGNYKNITIVGSAGSGKTTLLKYIFLNSIKKAQKIPVIIELRNLNDTTNSLEDLISEKILKSRIKPSENTFQRTLKEGSFLFLFDGYDEIFSKKKQEINRQIELFVDTYSENNFLITTRPGSGIEGFSRFFDFQVCELDDEDVRGFITKIVEEKERRTRINDIIDDPKNRNFIAYLRNPLLLSMFIMAFESHPEIPTRKSAFYRNVFDTLYSKHDGITKNSFPREKLTKLQRDEFERILNIFSYLSLTDGQYTFTEEYLTDIFLKIKKNIEFSFKIDDLLYDLRTTISILVLDGFEYHFPHRSMQEYFTAQFISNLPSEKKHKVYNNLLVVLENSSNDYSFNLWSLCNEMDYTAFMSHFVIPQLQKLEQQFSKKDDLSLFKLYVKLSQPSLFQAANGKLQIFKRRNFYNALVDFVEVYDYKMLFDFPHQGAVEEELLNYLAADSHDKSHKIFSDKKGIEILFKHGIVEILRKYKKELTNKISFLQTEVDKRKSSIDDLLNF